MTDTNNGWPDKPGVPLDPEKDGAHRLRHQVSGLESDALWSSGGTWLDLSGNFSIPHASTFYDYLGPVLTPDEATALQKRADQSALGYAREARRADLFKFLHKRDVAAMQDRIAALEAALRKINDKDSYSRGSYGPFAEIARAALEGGKKDE